MGRLIERVVTIHLYSFIHIRNFVVTVSFFHFDLLMLQRLLYQPILHDIIDRLEIKILEYEMKDQTELTSF